MSVRSEEHRQHSHHVYGSTACRWVLLTIPTQQAVSSGCLQTGCGAPCGPQTSSTATRQPLCGRANPKGSSTQLHTPPALVTAVAAPGRRFSDGSQGGPTPSPAQNRHNVVQITDTHCMFTPAPIRHIAHVVRQISADLTGCHHGPGIPYAHACTVPHSLTLTSRSKPPVLVWSRQTTCWSSAPRDVSKPLQEPPWLDSTACIG